ncbi:hypothetical protein AVEN_89994-1 [Araneus ventricosus]|uniref:Uncharacterized protein n=1 Tax=Araneus ventricosus TaxID=182803 RepID=A0A4Y2DC76_ARAVE|nr:hypothetical protein AVEN_89994-1 [Araneus ventricosus]
MVCSQGNLSVEPPNGTVLVWYATSAMYHTGHINRLVDRDVTFFNSFGGATLHRILPDLLGYIITRACDCQSQHGLHLASVSQANSLYFERQNFT